MVLRASQSLNHVNFFDEITDENFDTPNDDNNITDTPLGNNNQNDHHLGDGSHSQSLGDPTIDHVENELGHSPGSNEIIRDGENVATPSGVTISDGDSSPLSEQSAGSGSMRDTIRCIHIGLLCVQENAVDRPTMVSVVHDMLDRYSITLQVPSWPAFFMHSSTDPEVPLLRDYTSSTGSSGLENYKQSKSRSSQVSVNDVSLSEVVPR
ncbi:protein kinase-like domain, Concanavalin A-like lectin/glucanase domain protein [Artemisia annua]|uniref:Protein kinase-like domain, Concanavalin A-like lectin/glucanase domain protein n=1 Tax=Artemisia annua TaxID=35608 RepID=A0A2U1QCX4_ARTAN|nr:protein kinase-like domain, Concanavalin A-like lectin/glucanase domain protein [Artemisia annua]